MSEKTLAELATQRVLDARAHRAEAAERAIEAWMAWCDSGDAEGTWDAFRSAVAEYEAAREAVRKLEEATVVANRVDAIKAIGNGQVPAVAALAWRLLTEGQT